MLKNIIKESKYGKTKQERTINKAKEFLGLTLSKKDNDNLKIDNILYPDSTFVLNKNCVTLKDIKGNLFYSFKPSNGEIDDNGYTKTYLFIAWKPLITTNGNLIVAYTKEELNREKSGEIVKQNLSELIKLHNSDINNDICLLTEVNDNEEVLVSRFAYSTQALSHKDFLTNLNKK